MITIDKLRFVNSSVLSMSFDRNIDKIDAIVCFLV